MIRKIMPVALALPTAVMLAACGGGSSSASGSAGEPQANSLTYSYPLQEQEQVPTPAPVVLRFSQSIRGLGMGDSVVLRLDGQEVDTTTRLTTDGRSLILTPTEKLQYHTEYTVDFPEDSGIEGGQDITFSTRAAQEGIKANVITGDTMDVTRTMPSGGEQDPMMDFSTIRLQFTQPLDQKTLVYGQGGDSTVSLLDGNGDLVPAWMLVNGPYLTIDPKEDLTPGQSYRLAFEDGTIQSIYGESFAFPNSNRFRFNPASSLAEGKSPNQRPQPLVQRITTPNDEGAGNGLSPLTGEPINAIPVNAMLLGGVGSATAPAVTQQEGDVLGDLAFLPDWPTVSPLRIRRGTLLTGSSIDVKIGGKVEAGFDSGQVRVQFLSDANGYLIPNVYDPDGPRMVRLFMDVAMSTEDAIANGGVTQNITHLELIGTVSTDTDAGVIDINAVGVVEPMILGLERGYGTLSFQLQTYRDQTDQLVEDVRIEQGDTTPPMLQSWIMGDDSITGDEKAVLAKPGDPIIMNFDEPIEPGSVKGKVRVYDANNREMDIDYYVDGAALVIQLKETTQETGESTKVTQPGFQLSPAENPNVYRVEVDGATDLAGNMAVGMPLIRQFELATIVPDYDLTDPQVAPDFTTSTIWRNRRDTSHSPVILAAYPGYPCALQKEFTDAGGVTGLFDGATDIGQKSYRDLANGVAGMCAGGAPAIADGTERDNRAADDAVPVMDMPANRPIIIAFGKEIDPSTVVLGETFMVERIDEDEQVLEEVAGTVEISDMTLWFRPSQSWQKDELYRYTLKSSGWAICQTGGANSGVYRLVASEATEIVPCNASNIRAGSDHRNFQCGVDAVCDNEGLPLRTMPLAINVMRKIANPSASAIRQYTWKTSGPSITAGGPDMTHFFRGAAPSPNILQVLRTQPVSDTNRNFISERSNVGAGDLETMLGIRDVGAMFGLGAESWDIISSGEFDYDVQEYGPEGALTPDDPGYGLHADYDPNGVKPAKNSAKVLSRFDSQGVGFALSGGNVGCASDSDFAFDPSSGFTSEIREPFECPDNKFSYLTTAVIAEVTDEVTAQGIKVNLWPSVVMGTSLDLYIRVSFLGAFDYMAGTLTGPQVLRMRYSGDNRNQPVTGWISEQDQHAALSVDMDLFVDAPYASEWAPITNPVNLISYPIQMSLEGGVTFLDDGRMEVEQENVNLINLDVQLWDNGGKDSGYIDLFIPEYGSRINMISEPIK